MRNGRITKRYKPKTVANTGVSVTAFGQLIEKLKTAQILTSTASLQCVQTVLKAHVLYAGPIDGTYGRLTRIAIKQFEKRRGWPITGLPTEKLMAHFQSELKTVTNPAISETSVMSETSATP